MPDPHLIVVFADPITRKVEIEFPTPEGGILEPEMVKMPGGGERAILYFDKATQEQKAHYVFWDNGTQERIRELTANGRGAGLRQTLKWLLNMRIWEVQQKTGWEYRLEVISRAKTPDASERIR